MAKQDEKDVIRDMAENVMFSFYEPDDYINGVSFRDWTIRWFKWVLEKPMDDTNPLFTEIVTADMQPYLSSHNVWFLAGGYEALTALPDGRRFSQAFRKVKGLPSTASVLMPVLNFFLADRKHRTGRGKQESLKNLKEAGEAHTNNLLNAGAMVMEINGQRISVEDLKKYRVNTHGLFEVTIPGKNSLTRMRHALGRPIECFAKGDGYWLFWKPGQFKPQEKYGLHSFATCAKNVVQIDTTYKLEIV